MTKKMKIKRPPANHKAQFRVSRQLRWRKLAPRGVFRFTRRLGGHHA